MTGAVSRKTGEVLCRVSVSWDLADGFPMIRLRLNVGRKFSISIPRDWGCLLSTAVLSPLCMDVLTSHLTLGEQVTKCSLAQGWSCEVKVAQLCPALCDPMDYTAHGILQARILEWVAYPFSRGSSQPRNRTWVSHLAGGFFANWVIKVIKCSLAQGWSCGERQLRLCRFKKNIILFLSLFYLKNLYEHLQCYLTFVHMVALYLLLEGPWFFS